MKLSELMAGQLPPRHLAGARELARNNLVSSGKRLVVVDDDPTGVQTIHGVSILMDWSVAVLRKALTSRGPVFFISTNSRSLSPQRAREISLEVGSNLREAGRLEGADVLLASRGDSTLRGHFPYEVEALMAGLGLEADGVILVPAFIEAGRYTVDDIQWVEQDGEVVPVDRTEFARDPVFGFKNGDLKAWAAEKLGGRIGAGDVRSISLELIRGAGPDGVAESLLSASGGKPIVLNAASYDDLDTAVLGILKAEAQGKIFVYRCAASFIKARGGFDDRPLLGADDLAVGPGPGLTVVGSYVDKTTRQLKRLLNSGLVEGIEFDVAKMREAESRRREIDRAAEAVNRKLAAGINTALFTSRKVQTAAGADFLRIGEEVVRSLGEILGRIHNPPSYLVAKGGMTSLGLARDALQVKEAFALGQILGGVPVVRLGAESRWANIPYVIFPGNVGDDEALLTVIEVLTRAKKTAAPG